MIPDAAQPTNPSLPGGLECWEVDGGNYLVFVFSLPDGDAPDPLSRLTEAEREVATLVLCGYSNAEIGESRHCSRHTVANQLKSACRKLGVSGRIGLAQSVAGRRAKTGASPKK